jgi:sugar lactone lactonase YvrE
MLLWQSPASPRSKLDREGQSSRSRHRRGRARRRGALPLVTLLEERTLLSIPTVTTLGFSPASPTFGAVETLTATVATQVPTVPPSTPVGSVTFMDGTVILGTMALGTKGMAKLSNIELSAGNHVVTALYAGGVSGALDFDPSRSTSSSLGIGTVAGGGDPAGRQALYTSLSDPEGVAVDSSGNLFIADSNHNVVEEVNATNRMVTVVAGDGSPTTGTPPMVGVAGVPAASIGDGGPATLATLNFPEGVVVEGTGTAENLFIADTFDNVIREVNLATGIIETYAGNYATSYVDLYPFVQTSPPTTPGPPLPFSYNGDAGVQAATASLLYGPIGISFDNFGNLFIADSYNNLIREVIGPTPTTKEVGAGEVAGDMITVAGKYDSTDECCNQDAVVGATAAKATNTVLDGPSGVAADSKGNLFIADTFNNVIREVDGSGDISTYAGMPTNGNGVDPGPGGGGGDGGLATKATLHSPQGIYVTASGDLFFTDAFNNAIREVSSQVVDGTTENIINPVAGDGNQGDSGDGGLATAAELDQPSWLTMDGAGDLFIADTFNNSIREVSAIDGAVNPKSSVITTIAGGDASGYSENGPVSASELAGPSSVAVDSSNNIFVADTSNNVVREVNPQSGMITTVAGGAAPVYYNPLSGPADVAMDSAGDLFIADTYNNEVDEVDLATGQEAVVAGDGTAGDSGDGGKATNAELDYPEGVAVDSDGTHLFISDTFNNVIREVKLAAGPDGLLTAGSISTIVGNDALGAGYSGDYDPAAGISGAATGAQLNGPVGIVWQSSTGDLFIADSGNNVIRKVVPGSGGFLQGGGIITTYAGEYKDGLGGYSGDGGPATSAQLNGPSGIALDGSGNLYIADSDNNRVREVLSNGTIEPFAGDGVAGGTADGAAIAATSAELDDPSDVVVAGPNEVLIADTGNNVICKVVSGMISGFVGDGGDGDGGDGGPAAGAQLSTPAGLVVHGGNLFIADSGNNVIREVNANNVITTVVGGNGGLLYTNDDGPATAATLANPDGIAVQSLGGSLGDDVFISDENFNVVRELNTVSGNMTTIAGTGESGALSSGDLATDAELAGPAGLALDGHGDLFIADSGNNVIRKVNLASGTIMTVAGDGISGYSGDKGLATAAEISDPTGVAVDSFGDIFIADSGNNLIREVLVNGTITTVAGGGTHKSPNYAGPATGAVLSNPTGVALDLSNDLFIADTGNDVIREVSGGTIMAIAGTGPPAAGSEPPLGFSGDGGLTTSARLSSPSAVAVDASGDIYIVDTDNNVVREVIGGQLITVAQAQPTVSVSDKGGTYNGLTFPATATVAGISGPAASSLEGVSPLLSYYSGTYKIAAQLSSLTPLSGPPSQAGAYTVQATFAGSVDFAGGSMLANFVIARTVPTVSVMDVGGTYNGTVFPATATVAGISGAAASSLEGVSPTLRYYSGTYTTTSQLAGIPVLSGAPSEGGSYTVLASFAGSTDYTAVSALDDFTITRATPKLAWAAPASIVYGTPLGAVQLDASSSVPGTFTYTPAAGKILNAGSGRALSALFTPEFGNDYTTATVSTAITVTQGSTEVLLVPQPIFQKKKLVSVGLTAEFESLPAGASVPSGMVTFELLTKKGKKTQTGVLGTVALSNGEATLTVALDRVQNKEVTIVYHGDMDYMKSTVTSPKVTKKGLRSLARPLVMMQQIPARGILKERPSSKL